MKLETKMAPEVAATASRALDVVSGKPTLVHSAPDRCAATPSCDKSTVVGLAEPFFECRKAGGYVMRVQFDRFERTTYLDVRWWVDQGGELQRTKKGVTIPLERVQEVGEAC